MARQYGNNTAASSNARAQVAEEMRQRSTIIHAVEWIIAGSMLVTGIGFLVSGVLGSTNSSKELERVNSEISSQTLVMNDKKLQLDNNSNKVEMVVNSAAEMGMKICNLQNSLNTEIRNGSNGYTTGNLDNNVTWDDYKPLPMTDAHKQYIQDLRSVIPSEVTGGLRSSWCSYGTWLFEGTYTYASDEAKTFSFACYALDEAGKIDENRLLSVVFMKYYPSEGLFKSGKIYRTKYYYEEQLKTPLILSGDETEEEFKERLEEMDVIIPGISDDSDSNNDNEYSDAVIPGINDDTDSSGSGSATVPVIVPTLDLSTIDINDTQSNPGSTDSNNDGPTNSSTTQPTVTQPVVTTPAELEYFYSWSSKYGEWGYFDSNGVFYTIDEYEELMR